jgi:hypothetical protein
MRKDLPLSVKEQDRFKERKPILKALLFDDLEEQINMDEDERDFEEIQLPLSMNRVDTKVISSLVNEYEDIGCKKTEKNSFHLYNIYLWDLQSKVKSVKIYKDKDFNLSYTASMPRTKGNPPP